MYKTFIEQNISFIINSVANMLSSANPSIKNNADILIDLIMDTIDNVFLIQPFAKLSQIANVRSKANIIQRLCEIIPEVYKSKPGLVNTYVIPSLIYLIEENKIEIKASVSKLIKTLYKMIGKSIFEFLPPSKHDKIKEFI